MLTSISSTFYLIESFIVFFYIALVSQVKPVRQNSIYEYVFLYSLLQVWIVELCDWKPPAPEVCLELFAVDFIFFLGLICLVVYQFGLKNFFITTIKNLQAHPYSPCTFSGLFFILGIYVNRYDLYSATFSKKRSEKGYYFKEILINYVVLTILILNIVKEILKRVYLILLLSLAFQYFFVVVLFYAFKFTIFIFLVSSLALDRYIVAFLTSYLGPYALGWLGNIQSMKYSLDDPNPPYYDPSELDLGKLLSFAKKNNQHSKQKNTLQSTQSKL